MSHIAGHIHCDIFMSPCCMLLYVLFVYFSTVFMSTCEYLKAHNASSFIFTINHLKSTDGTPCKTNEKQSLHVLCLKFTLQWLLNAQVHLVVNENKNPCRHSVKQKCPKPLIWPILAVITCVSSHVLSLT